MKLTSAQAYRVLAPIGASPLPDGHPLVAELNVFFGEHTFFLDGRGLNIVEPVAIRGSAVQTAEIVNLAGWSDDEPYSLEVHEPEPTDVFVRLVSKH
jgi:hypothetical protein